MKDAAVMQAETKFALDKHKSGTELEYVRWMRMATGKGKSLLSMAREIVLLAAGPGKLQPKEYFQYGLYDDARYSWEAKKTFLGADRQKRILATSPSPWPRIAGDKPTFTALLRGHDLPIPHTQAMLHGHRHFPGAAALRNLEDVARFLRTQATYPLFGKPAALSMSRGVASFERLDRDNDRLITMEGRAVPVAEFVSQLGEDYLKDGYIFQTRMASHPEIQRITGHKQLSSMRVFVIEDDEGPVLLRSSWKIPRQGSVADNFWRSGNILAGIDVDAGRITRAFQRTANGTVPITTHPDTGVELTNMEVPCWQDIRSMVLRGAAAVPGCYFQGWDVALTDNGPVLVELEGDGGDPIMEQLCFETGLLQGRYLELIDTVREKQKEAVKELRTRLRSRVRQNFKQLSVRPQ